MVITDNKIITLYICEKCGERYAEMETALFCENHPISPFLYQIGETVLYKDSIDSTREKTGIIEERIIEGLPERGKYKSHSNTYNVKVLNSMFHQFVPEVCIIRRGD